MGIFPYNIARLVLLACILLFSGKVGAQYRLELSKTSDSTVVRSIYKGFKVTYKLDNHEMTTARITEINADQIITTKDTFELSEIDFIAYQKPLSQLMKMGAQITYYGSFGILVLAYYAYTRFPNVPELGTILAIMGFVPLTISRRIIQGPDYALFDLVYQWDAQIVPR